MSVTGRTTERWGRDRSARWDPGPTNRTRSYPSAPRPAAPDPQHSRFAELTGRPGNTERLLRLRQHGTSVDIALSGWYTETVTLNERQVRFLRDTLNQWLAE